MVLTLLNPRGNIEFVANEQRGFKKEFKKT